MKRFRSSAIIDKGDLTTRRPGRTSVRRARPLTRTQEVLLVAIVLVVGGVLQMLVILDIGSILE